MEVKRISFKQLDEIIDRYREDLPQKKALLILKSGTTPLREKGIDRHHATKITTAAKSSESLLAKGYEDEDDVDMYVFHAELATALGKVVPILFEQEEE